MAGGSPRTAASCCWPPPIAASGFAAEIADRRDPDRIVHLLPDIPWARILAIACGFEDADDLDRLRTDPAFKLACDRLADSGRDLCSQPTVSRWENAPNLRELIRLMGVLGVEGPSMRKCTLAYWTQCQGSG
jgi:hypothetical protein